MGYEVFDGDITLRDQLAIDRTDLANSRTALAYLRTGVLIMLAGFTVLKLQGLSTLTWSIFIFCICISGLLLSYGVTKRLYYKRNLEHISTIAHRQDMKAMVKQQVESKIGNK